MASRPRIRLPGRASGANRTNAALGVLALLVAAVFWSLVPYGVPVDHAAMGITGRFFPRTAALIVGVSGLVLVLRSLFSRGTGEPVQGLDAGSFRRIAPYLALTVGYVAVIDLVGYLTSTVFALAGLLWLAGARSRLVIGCVALGVPVALYLLFQYLMDVPLPRGILI